MLSPSLFILDVGHGNSAVLVDTDGVVVIDAGPGSHLLEFLEAESISHVDTVLISHSDADHIAGLLGLLSASTVSVARVALNSDAAKGTDLWDDLVYELDRLDAQGKVTFETSLVRDLSGRFNQGLVQIDVLAPSKYLAARGPGSQDRQGRRISGNSMSAVFQLSMEQRPVVLLTGDIDDVGLEHLISDNGAVNCPISTFPHHGGLPGSVSAEEFARRFCGLVSSRSYVFSIGRGSHGTPRPEIIGSIREVAPEARVVCTQLSKHCAPNEPEISAKHLNPTFSAGKATRRCCAGTFAIDLASAMISPGAESHAEFIEAHAVSPLCQLRVAGNEQN